MNPLIANPIVKKIAAECGIRFAYYFVQKYGGGLINKIDQALLSIMKDVVEGERRFHYYCPDCRKEFDLFYLEKDDKAEEIFLSSKCMYCKSENITLRRNNKKGVKVNGREEENNEAERSR